MTAHGDAGSLERSARPDRASVPRAVGIRALALLFIAGLFAAPAWAVDTVESVENDYNNPGYGRVLVHNVRNQELIDFDSDDVERLRSLVPGYWLGQKFVTGPHELGYRATIFYFRVRVATYDDPHENMSVSLYKHGVLVDDRIRSPSRISDPSEEWASVGAYIRLDRSLILEPNTQYELRIENTGSSRLDLLFTEENGEAGTFGWRIADSTVNLISLALVTHIWGAPVLEAPANLRTRFIRPNGEVAIRWAEVPHKDSGALEHYQVSTCVSRSMSCSWTNLANISDARAEWFVGLLGDVHHFHQRGADADRQYRVRAYNGMHWPASRLRLYDRGVVVAPIELNIDEAGSDHYTVVLGSPPTAAVIVESAVSGDADVTVSPESLTFTASTWSTEQTVTVSARDDMDMVGDYATVAHTVSGGGYGGESAASVDVTVNDDDTASTKVKLRVDVKEVTEGGGEQTIAVTGRLDEAPRAQATVVTVTVAGGTATAVTDFAAVADFELTIAAEAGSGTGTFALAPVDDEVEEADETVTVNGTVADAAAGLTVTGTQVKIIDDDEVGVSVEPTALKVNEGASGTYTVVLDSEPTTDVDVVTHLHHDYRDVVTINRGVLIFTDTTWSTKQTVTVTARQYVAEAVSIEHHVFTGGGGSYSADEVAVTVLEVDRELTLVFGPPAVDDNDRTGDVTLGDVLRYEAVVRNSGNVPLTNVTVSDELTSVANCGTLDIGETCDLWRNSHEVTQADVDAGVVEKTVTAFANEGADEQASQSTTVVQERALTLQKTASVGSFAGVGEEIEYTYTVSNSGTAKLAGMVTIEDDKIPASGIKCGGVPADGLGSGGTVTCTGSYTTEQADVDGAQVVNTASATLDGVRSNRAVEVLWVENEGEPTMSVISAEGPEGAGSLAFRVKLSAASEKTVEVEYATEDGTATAGSDYTTVAGELTFEAGKAGTTELTIAVTIADDAVDEADESFTVTLKDAVNATLGLATATGTITDDDARGVNVEPTDLEVNEDDSNSYTVVLESQPTADVTVAVTVPADAEFTVDPASLTFTDATWLTKQTVTVKAQRDDDAVAAEAVSIGHEVSGGDYEGEAADGVAVTVLEADTASAELTLEFDAPALDEKDSSGDVTLGDVLNYKAAAENSGNVPLTNVTVSDELTGAVEVICPTLGVGERCEWSGSHGVTQADVDAGEVANTVTAGADDVADEQASQSTTVAQVRALTLQKTTVVEGFLGVGERIPYTYRVSNSGTVTLAGTVTIEDDKIGSGITCEAVPADGLGPGGTVTCRAIYTIEQADVDGAEVVNTASATLDGVESEEVTARVEWVGAQVEQLIQAEVSVGNASGPEGAGSLAFGVSLSAASPFMVTVGYATEDGTATAGSDYTASEGELTFEAGTTELTIAVPIADDAVDEADESFTVTLRDAVDVTLAGGEPTLSATGTITDDDDRGVTVSPTKLEVTEGASDGYTVVLRSQPTGEVTVAVSVPEGTDVTVDEATLTFTSSTWEEAQTVTVVAAEDDDALADEAVTLTHQVSGGDYGSNGVSAEPVAVTIVENDTPTLSVSDQRAGEASGEMVFTVTLSQASSAEVVVDYATADGTAAAGTDYTEATGTLTFAAETTAAQEIRVAIAGDKVDEEDETFTVTLSGAVNATLAGGEPTLSATGTIEDDDERGVTVSPTELRVTEGGSDGYTVVLSSKPTGEVTVAVSVPEGAEFTVDEEELTFGAGDWATAQKVTVTADRDDDAVAASAASIEHEVSGGDYAGEAAAAVAVTVVEADTARAELTLEYEAPEHSDADDDGEVTLGDELSYEASARNSGNVPLKNVTVSDERVGGAAKTCATLGIGESCLWSGSYGVTQADVDAGEVKNTVTATADEVADQEASESTTVAQERELTLEKSAMAESFGTVDESISYTYTVSNSGTVTLAGTVTIADDKIESGITCEEVPEDGLGPDGTVTCTGSYTTVQADVDVSEVVNRATATLAGAESNEATERVTWRAPQGSQPTVQFGVGAVAGVETVGRLRFSVTLSAASRQTVTVGYQTADVTATAGSDYTAAAVDSVLTFTAGTTQGTIEVAIAGDKVDEEDETFTVTLSGAVNATLGAAATATGMIEDDDERGVTVSPTELEVTEGGSDGYTVVLSSKPTGEVTVAVSVPEGTDVTVDEATLTFTSSTWEEAQTVTVSADEDDDALTDDAVDLTHQVSGGDYGSNGVSAETVEVKIVENDTPTLSVSDQRAGEATGEMVFTVTLSQASSAEVVVDYASGDGTAKAGTDYTEATGKLTFPATTTAAQEIRVAIADDKVDEANETFMVTLSGAANATLAGGEATLTATGTIEDDDERGVTVSPTKLRVTEGASDGYTVVLRSQPTGEVTVAVSVPAGTDVTVDEDSLTFTSSTWAVAQTVEVSVADDDDALADEAVTLTHQVTGGDYGSNGVSAEPVAVTIVENDTPTLSVSDQRAGEASGEMVFTVTLSQASSAEVVVDYASGDGTAKAGTDYTEATGKLTFPATTTAVQEIRVAIADDKVDEANETFTVTLSGAANATLAGGEPTLTATGTIEDDDERGVTVSPTKLRVTEGASDGYTVVLRSQPTGEVTVAVSVPEGTDVTVDEDSLTFTSSTWAVAQTVEVSAVDDDDALTDDAVELTHQVTGGDYGTNGVSAEPVAVTIVENDTPTLSVSDQRAGEASGEMVFTVTLSQASSAEVVVDYATADGTAAAGTDYTEATGTLTFAAQTTAAQEIRVAIAGDKVDEEDETFTVTLSGAANATLAGGGTMLSATGTIEDDDERGVTVSPTKLEVTEGASDRYTVVLRSQPTGDVTVAVSVPAGAEFTVDDEELTFGAGDWATAQTVTVMADRDNDAVAAAAASIEHEVSGGDYAGEAAAEVAVTVVEADTARAELTLEYEAPEHSDADDDGEVTLGDELSYEARARNSGNVPLKNVTVSDERVGGAAKMCATLGIGESCEWSGSYEVTQADVDAGKVDNTVTATADDAADRQAGQSTPVAQEKGLTLEKTATEQSFGEVGETIGYTYTVSNSGTVTLAGTVTIADDKIESGITCEAVPVDGLGPGGTVTCTGSYTTTQADVDGSEVVNKATATLAGVQSSEATERVTWISTQAGQPTVELGVGAVSVVEAAGSLSFGVRLSAASQQTVTVEYETADATATAGSDYTAAAADSVLTFTAGTTEATIEVAIADDKVDEEDETFTVMLREPVNATLGAVATATATITDDDERGVTVIPTELRVTEGGSDGYTVVLRSQPTGEVTVAMAASGDEDVTVSPESLTFTTGDWATAQTVTVRADGDVDGDDDTATITHTVGGGDYTSESAKPVTVTVDDDETASTTVTLSVEPAAVAEQVSAHQITVTGTLDEAPRAQATAVTVSVAGDTATAAADFAAVADFELTIAAGELSGTGTFALEPVNDDVDETDETVTVSGAVADAAAGLTVTGTQVTITDNDARGVTVSPTVLRVTEGGSDRYTVVLTSKPTAEVTVAVSVPEGTDVSVDEDSLTFTSSTWAVAQTVAVSAAEDDDALTDDAVELTHQVSGGDYGTNGVSAEPVEVTIVENDTPTLSVSDQRAGEASGEMVFTVTLSQASSAEVMVDYASGDGTAEAGTDYTEATGTLTFAAQTTAAQEIRVSIAGDKVDEEDETFTVTLSGAANATLAGGEPTLSATGTIEDDDERGVTVSPTKLEVTEGASDRYTVVLRSQPTGEVTVAVSVPEGTDVTVDEDSLTFTSSTWAVAQTVEVSAVDDDDALADDAVELTHQVSGGDYGSNGVSAETVEVKIVENDTPTLSVSDARAGESAGELAFTVSLSQASSAEVVVDYASGDGTAEAGTDYTEATGTLTFAAQTTAAQEIRVAIAGDKVDEEDETFTVTLSGAVNATLAGGEPTLTATGTIEDDDERGVTVSPTKLEVTEGASDRYTVVLRSQPTGEVTVAVSVPAGTDVSVDEATLTFTSSTWAVAQTVEVSAVDDDDALADDAVELTHQVSGGDYGSNGVSAETVEVKIVENDTPTLSVSDQRAGEASGEMVFTVTLSQASSAEVVVDYATADGTAAAGTDYTEATGTLTFAAQTTAAQEIRVAIAGDKVDEEDETFTVTLSGAVNATLAGGEPTLSATGTITDDDARGVTVSPTKLEVTEGASDRYTVVLASQPTGEVTVAVSVPAGTDVTVDEATLTFTSSTWEEAQTVTVRAAEDDDALADEAVTLTHQVTGGDYGSNGVSAEPVAVTIVENDTPTLSVSDQRAGEASGEMVFAVTLSQASSAEVVVDYATADGTAEAGTDYTEATGTLTFAAQTTAAQEIRVAIADDTVDEEDETFTVTLSDATNAALAGGGTTLTVTGTIEDDDDPAVTAVTLSVEPASVAEEGGAREITVTGTLDQAPRAQATAVTVSVAGDPVTVAADFVAVADFELTIAAGDMSGTGTFTLQPMDDDVHEADETVTVSGAAPGTDLSVTETQVTIIDNDKRGVAVKPTELELTAGDSATYKVVLGSKPTDTVTVRMAVSGDDDMTVSPESLTFMTGTWAEAQTITVTAGPNVDEGGPPTKLTHQVSGADYEGMPAEPVTVTIPGDDTEPGPEPGPEPELTIADAHAMESAGFLEFVVELSAASSRQVTMDYATEAGTATEGADYTRTVGTLTFEPGGALRHTIAVPIVNDALDEADSETFTVAISGASNATAGAAATGTILDDDAVPELTIADVRAVESTGMMEFTVRLGAPSGRQVAVTCFSEDGTATAGDDYEPELGTLVLEPGQKTGVISVPILDDRLDEADEHFTMVLSDPVNATLADGTATGTILDDDASVAGMWLSRFGRTVATHELAAIDERLSGQLGRGAQVTIAGQRLEYGDGDGDGGVAAGEPDLFAPSPVRTMDVPELLQGSSFLLTGTAGDESAADTGSGTGARWSAWGSGEATQLAGKDREVSLQGRVVTATVGADYERGPIVAGVAVAYSAGDGEFTVPAMDERPGRQISVDSSLMSVHPYVRVAANERLALWGMLGYGRGRMAMDGGDVETGIEMKMGAFGASGALLVPTAGVGLGLDLKSDGFLVLMASEPTAAVPVVEADASRVRLVLDGSLGVPLGVAGVLTPSFEVGVRHDGGDAETGTGLEVGGGVRYVYPAWGLTLAANGRVLITHQDLGYDEWGAGGSLRVDPGAPGRGLALDVNSSWGTAASGVARLWALPGARELADERAVAATVTAGRLDAEIRYGLGADDAVVTPYAGLTLDEGGDRAYRLGSRLSLGPSFSLSLEADRRERAGVEGVAPDMGVTLNGTVRW